MLDCFFEANLEFSRNNAIKHNIKLLCILPKELGEFIFLNYRKNNQIKPFCKNGFTKLSLVNLCDYIDTQKQ